MDDRIAQAITLYNRLVAAKRPDIERLVRQKSIGQDDFVELLAACREVDAIYEAHAEALDHSLRLKAEMIRTPLHDALGRLASHIQVAAATKTHVPPWQTALDQLGLMRLVSYRNDLRDIAAEQIGRYQAVLGKDAIPFEADEP